MSFKVFCLGAFVASRLEIALWEAYLDSTRLQASRPKKSVDSKSSSSNLDDGFFIGASSAADGEMALRSKAHLAEFWNRLVPGERRKILGIGENVVDPRQCRSFRNPAGFTLDRSVTASSLTSGTGTDGDRGDDMESGQAYGSDTESEQQGTSAAPSFACGNSSIDIPSSVGQPSSALSVKSDHYRRDTGMRYKYPILRRNSSQFHNHLVDGTSINAVDRRVVLSGVGSGSTCGSSRVDHASGVADEDSDIDNDFSVDDDGASDCPDVWPWCAVRWPGRELVASLFQSPLDRAGVTMFLCFNVSHCLWKCQA